jgi:hypothetical protein
VPAADLPVKLHQQLKLLQQQCGVTAVAIMAGAKAATQLLLAMSAAVVAGLAATSWCQQHARKLPAAAQLGLACYSRGVLKR